MRPTEEKTVSWRFIINVVVDTMKFFILQSFIMYHNFNM